MSMNKYMHPRNIYKDPPNFRQLALDFPDFKRHVAHDITGKVSIDFKNVDALRALTCTLLRRDFDLDLHLPPNKLIPTVPLRLNYILWLEDLLSITGREESLPVRGIDIGTGASCIYPLLAARKNGWHMLGLEMDADSLRCAADNVTRNHLDHLIELRKCDACDDLITSLDMDSEYDFSMCNPPFFATAAELHPHFKARTQHRPRPKNAFCATVGEVVAKGGEVDYVSNMIRSSCLLGTRIRIYSTMIGHKSSLPPLKQLLRESHVISFKQTEFCQGNTTRWGLAWTFHDCNLKLIPTSVLTTKKAASMSKPLILNLGSDGGDIDVVDEKLLRILNDLNLDIAVNPLNNRHQSKRKYIEYTIGARSNTWSHQRRKKREQNRLMKQDDTHLNNFNSNNGDGSSSNDDSLHETCHSLAAIDVGDVGQKKRTFNEEEERDEGFYNGKKFRTETSDSVSTENYLTFKLVIRKVDDCMTVAFSYVGGTGTKEAMHQVLQYIKNNFQ